MQKKRQFPGQIDIFSIGQESAEDESQNIPLQQKYHLTMSSEYPSKQLLGMEKEMLGIYISGHPLEPLRKVIEEASTISTKEMKETQENILNGTVSKFKDGDNVKYAGIINSVKKKYTKTNKIMAFLNVEDLYGQTEVIAFENCYNLSQNSLLDDNIVLVEGRLSLREDEAPKIVANVIKEFGVNKKKTLSLTITDLSEEIKAKLRGVLRYFNGEKNNTQTQVIEKDEIKPCGKIYLTDEIAAEFKEMLGEERVKLEEV